MNETKIRSVQNEKNAENPLGAQHKKLEPGLKTKKSTTTSAPDFFQPFFMKNEKKRCLAVWGKTKNEKPRKNAPFSLYGFPGRRDIFVLFKW